ncbi:MAG: SURF1 family protein [Candidatus Nanopelagicales bacterium]
MSNKLQNPNPKSVLLKLFSDKNWVFFTLLIILAFAISIRLGFWQNERHQSRVEFNQNVEQALTAPSNDLSIVYQNASPWQKVMTSGEFIADSQKLVRRRYLEGKLGFWIVAKLRTNDGKTVLVNRGFIPATLAANETPQVEDPPLGIVQVEGYFQNLDVESEKPSDLPLLQVSSVNATQFELSKNDYQLFIHQINTEENLQPIPSPQLTFGSHLAYSLQWFAFAFMIVVGWIILTRKELSELRKLD